MSVLIGWDFVGHSLEHFQMYWLKVVCKIVSILKNIFNIYSNIILLLLNRHLYLFYFCLDCLWRLLLILLIFKNIYLNNYRLTRGCKNIRVLGNLHSASPNSDNLCKGTNIKSRHWSILLVRLQILLSFHQFLYTLVCVFVLGGGLSIVPCSLTSCTTLCNHHHHKV